MDAKFSDAHALGHKKDSSPKSHILITNPEPRPGHAIWLKKKRKEKQGVHTDYEN